MLKRSIWVLAILLLILFSADAFAATPTLGTISPSSGSGIPEATQSFVCTFSDSSGWTHLKEVYLIANPITLSYVNSGYLYYDQNSNLLYLRNDANTAWLGGYAPGSSNTIENSQIKLYCSQTSISGSGTTMTVTFGVSFKQKLSGMVSGLYLSAKDDLGSSVTWVKKGSYTVNRNPTIGTIVPVSGTGQINVSQLFTTTYSDLDGWQNIQYVYLLINSSTAGVNCPYFYYNQNYNKLYIRNDANTAWLGGYAPGSSNVIENSYAKLDCSLTSVSGSGSTMTVKWAVTLKQLFTGTKNTYLFVKDDPGAYVSLTKAGTWSIGNKPPSVGTISPSSGASAPDQTVQLISVYSDPDGFLDIQNVYLLVDNTTSLTNCCYVYYDANYNKLYIRNDANTAWLGGYAPGSSNVIENSYAKLSCALITVARSGNEITVKWSLSFKSVFMGEKKLFLSAMDIVSASSGLVQKGTWSILVSDTTSPVIMITEPLDGAILYD